MTTDLEPAGGREPAHPHRVNNSTRVMVAFPFSTIHVHEPSDAAQLAELLAQVCRAVASGASPEELQALGTEADELAARLRKH